MLALVPVRVLVCLSAAASWTTSAPTDPRLLSSYAMVDTPWYHYVVYAPAFPVPRPFYLPAPDNYVYSSVYNGQLIPEQNFDSVYYDPPRVPFEESRMRFPSPTPPPLPTLLPSSISCSSSPGIRDELPPQPQTVFLDQPSFGPPPTSPTNETKPLTSTISSLFSPNIIRGESEGDTGFASISTDRPYTRKSTPRPGYRTSPALLSSTPNTIEAILTPAPPTLDQTYFPADTSNPLLIVSEAPPEHTTYSEFPQPDGETPPGVTDPPQDSQRGPPPPVLYEAPGHATPQRR